MIQQIESKYWHLRKKLKLTFDITPINLEEEKKAFLEAIDCNSVYQPLFKYKANSNIVFIQDFENIKLEFSKFSHPLSYLYIEDINRTIQWINNFNDRENACDWLSDLYGRPSKELYNYAKEKIQYLNLSKENFHVSSEQTKILIQQKLNDFGFKNWDVQIVNNAARMSVNALERLVKVKNGTFYSEEELERLFVHEIGTHVWRAENGNKQNYNLFQFGFPNYMATEEGLALYAEEQNKLQDDNDMLKYCLRVIACYESYEKGFWELFNSINKHINNSAAFDIVARIKRGYTKTENLGGYTKDQVYLKGYLEIKKLSKEQRKKLYVGKIGTQHFDILDSISDINYNIPVPKWIE